MRIESYKNLAFTLPEILIAVAIFSVVATIVSTLYIQSFRETRRANLQNQIYEDARFIMTRIADEVKNGMIDYDEYFNQHVVTATLAPGGASVPGRDPVAPQHYGQNYGRYYSSFFHPGNDNALGFDCNTVTAAEVAAGVEGRAAKRNQRNCTPLRRTLDRNTGTNPFPGKAAGTSGEEENAFCGTTHYNIDGGIVNHGLCDLATELPLPSARSQNELYLVSADGFQKTILAREKIGVADDAYALSLLRLKGVDTNSDGLADHFVCDDEFQCRGGDGFDVTPNLNAELNLTTEDGACGAGGGVSIAADLPRSRDNELETFESDGCDAKSGDFSKDFVPISPFRVKITDLHFYISPTENPHYAFAEASEQSQPRVTIALTVANNPDYSGSQSAIAPLTLVQTVSSRVLSSIPAPILVR